MLDKTGTQWGAFFMNKAKIWMERNSSGERLA